MKGTTTPWRGAREEALAAMTPAERAAYDSAASVQVPTVPMLWRLARGLGRTLHIDIAA